MVVELAAGTTVNENVRLIRPLGKGAMGEVWVAEHLTLRTEVAVKFITQELGNKHHEVNTRFEQEAAMAAQIKSPYVVQTFDQGKMEDGTPFIVMELLEGESLQELMDRTGQLPPELVIHVAAQIARGMTKAHRLGIVHRDIKPDNVFVSSGDDGLFCKILDFGIAKRTLLPQVGGLTQHGIMIGTPEYMSPEQVMSSKDVDAHADIWAVTVTCYQMLTGALPFEGEAIGDLCVKLIERRYTAATTVNPALPAALDDFFHTAFAKKTEDRFPSVRELVKGLKRVFPELSGERELFETFDTGRPPPLAPLPGHRAATTPGQVAPTVLRDDGAAEDDGAADDWGDPDTEREPSDFHQAKTGTLNGSAANRMVPEYLRKRKLGGWMSMVIGGIVLLTLLSVVVSVVVGGGESTPRAAVTGEPALAPAAAAAAVVSDGDDEVEPAAAADADTAEVDVAVTPTATASGSASAPSTSAGKKVAPKGVLRRGPRPAPTASGTKDWGI